MRLTLRTMLAYLDDVLQPADTVELGKRIEESKFASDLVERIRTATRRARLGAPKVEGRGIGLDANSVAEYLDSTLPAERVADFEKVCLESDVHLAEVASCHQILTRVMAGESTPVPPGLKQRIVELAQVGPDELARRKRSAARKASMHAAAESSGNGSHSAADVAAPPVAGHAAGVAPPVAKRTTGTPWEALPWRNMAIALGATFLLAIGALRFLGPFDSRHPIARWLGTQQVAQTTDDSNDVVTEPNDSVPSSRVAPNRPNRRAKDTSDEAAPGESTAETKRDETVRTPSNDTAADVPPARKENAATTADDNKPGPADDLAVPVKPVPAPAEVPKAAADENAVAAKPAEPVATDVRGAGRVKGKASSKAPKETVEPPPAEVARLGSEDQVLASIDARDNLWYRLSRGTSLVAGKTYVVLPMYRPQILVPNSTHIMFVGPASFTMIESTGDEVGGGINLDRGRLVLMSAGKPGTKVPLNVAGLHCAAQFGEANAELAVEVRRYLPPGSDPNDDGASVIRLFYSRRGSVELHPEGLEPIRIPSDHVLTLADDEEPTLEASSFPFWSEVRNVSKLDRDSYEQLEGFLSPDRPLTLSLEEKTDFRKTEIRSLAARSLGALGEYEALFRELANDQQHSYWDRAVDDLREALARGPEEANKIHEALRRVRIEESELIMRLLRDYSPEQLEREGAAAELVGYLDHKSLDVRVLAFETLRRITGVTLYYRPEAPAERRRVPLQKWRERLRDGLIVYKTEPGPAPAVERKPAAKP